MINVMVCYAQIARQVSSRIYTPRRTLADKAAAALELDGKLVQWRETLPGYLHKDRNSLRQPEFVNKQSIPQNLTSTEFRNCFGVTVLSPSALAPSAFSCGHRKKRKLSETH